MKPYVVQRLLPVCNRFGGAVFVTYDDVPTLRPWSSSSTCRASISLLEGFGEGVREQVKASAVRSVMFVLTCQRFLQLIGHGIGPP